ncbi:GMC family oxidoreductase [Hyphococcus sp.]|uniref:GMC family oxidoreductase n=1 Tax=Hyphococcus sp. TaxID=2038636 RepID=UPI003CCB9655
MQETGTPDVLIIGAGASGGVVAKHLSANGFSVVALEQGDWTSQGDYPGPRAEHDLLAGQKWSADPNLRATPADYPIIQEDSDGPPIMMYNGVGGSTVMFAAVWVRPTPSDFRAYTLDGVGDDWPISYADLLPYYESTDIEFGASGVGGNPAYPPGKPPPLPSLPIGDTGRKAAEGMNALGWHWWPGVNAIASAAHGNQEPCKRYGTCVTGCPAGAKGSTDITHWPEAIKQGAQLITGARVKEITLDSNNRATGAVYIDRDGNEQFQPGALVVLAGNAIGTSRLLLMSQSSRFPNGLANSSGLVGKRLMLHPSASVAGTFDDEFEEMGPSGQKIGSMQFYESQPDRGFVRGGYWTLYDGVGPYSNMVRRSLAEGLSGESFWGSNFETAMKESARHTIMWAVVAEDLPDENNFVELDTSQTDSDGLAAVRIHYTLAENTKAMIDWNCEKMKEALDAAGAKRSFVVMRNVPPGHVLGTARMGADPASSVVDPWCRSHDIPNLYIVDGSVFVTAFGVNPTSTIAAIAKRAATRIAETARDQETAA